MEKFTLECNTSSDESSFCSNNIEEFTDSDDEDLNDGILQATVIQTQVAKEVIPILSPEKNDPIDEAFELAVSLKNGDEKLNYSEKELAFIKNCARLEKNMGSQ